MPLKGQQRFRWGWQVWRLPVVGALLAGSALTPAAGAPAFANGLPAGTVASYDIWEASGLAASRQNPGVLWVHNDSGYRGYVFALSTNGTLLGRYYVPDVYYGDFEDLAIGPGPQAGQDYLYLGDIGDNYLARSSIRVFRFPEPAVYAFQSNAPGTQAINGAQEIELRYPDGPYNAEALLLDPLSGDLFIATKLTNSSRIYRATRTELAAGAPITLTFMNEITFRSVSAGDVSADGSMVALRRNNNARVWTRQAGQSLDQALAANGNAIPVIGQPEEPNGEALAFSADNAGYYTLSEGGQPTLYFFPRTDAGIPAPNRVFIQPGEVWQYHDFGFAEDDAWREADYDDSWWNAGPARFGYGLGGEATVIEADPEPLFRIPTTYFRKRFVTPAGPTVNNLALRILFSSGTAVFLNGREILRRNLAAGAGFGDWATSANVDRQNAWLAVPVNSSFLRAGTNVLAVEVHQFAPDAPGLSFDLQLYEGKVEAPPQITGLPQLTGGSCRLEIAGPSGVWAEVETSERLPLWLPARRLVLTNGTAVYQEPSASDARRFFRIRP